MLKSSFGTGQVCTEHNDAENKKKTSQNTWEKSEKGFHSGSVGKEFACKTRDPGLIPVWKSPSRREWLPTPVFLAWRIPWTVENSRLPSMWLQRIRYD